jgi:hypothetical protein
MTLKLNNFLAFLLTTTHHNFINFPFGAVPSSTTCVNIVPFEIAFTQITSREKCFATHFVIMCALNGGWKLSLPDKTRLCSRRHVIKLMDREKLLKCL